MTVGREIRVRSPVYPHRCGPSDGKEVKDQRVFGRPGAMECRGRLDTLKTPSCPWSCVSGSRSKFGKLDNCPITI